MSSPGKYYELLDFVRFACPSVLTLKSSPTAAALQDRMSGGGFMSYGQIWPQFDLLVKGLADESFVESAFSAYRMAWKNESIRGAFRLLRSYFGGKGNWYKLPQVRKYVLGCWFKTSIKGFWVFEGKVYAVLVNCRKSQTLSQEDIRFLARGIYELYCIDNPNNPIPLIVDLSQHPEDNERKFRAYEILVTEAISIEAFESSLREFLVASNMAGISLPPPDTGEVLDLFRH